MKKNKNGFFMAETIVIIAVVAVVLLGVYKQFNSVYYRYIETENYNTENAINALANIQRYYESKGIIDTSIVENEVYIDITNDEKYQSEFYTKIKEEFDVDFIYLFNLSNLNDTSGFNYLLRRYLDTIKNKSNYAIVISVRGGEFTHIQLEEGKEVRLVGNKDDEYAVYLSVGTEFTDPGYINWDGDEPTTSWEGDNEIDINKKGTYYLHYNFNGILLRRKIVVGDLSEEFDYTGGEQTFTADISGYYKLEVWGAQGGTGMADAVSKNIGGYGGYSTGEIYLNKGETIYINVGGKGEDAKNQQYGGTGGYNGGGNGGTDSNYSSSSKNEPGGAGGGATHISKISGEISNYTEENISNLLILAGGGGGGSYSAVGGSGGGINGSYGNKTTTIQATQSTGYSIGKGQDGLSYAGGSGGGGGGLAGGYAGPVDASSGAGGSGFIGNLSLINKSMYCYNCTESTGTDTYTVSSTNVSDTPTSYYAKSGNGYAKIYFMSNVEDTEITKKEFDYTGHEEYFVVNKPGTYKIEVWGAQGGTGMADGTSKNIGGYGGYATGNIYLNKGDILYVYIGGKGENAKDQQYGGTGGYNGGGNGGTDANYSSSGGNEPGGAGGGATHISKTTGLLSTYTTGTLSNLIIVAGGGGGGTYSSVGGSGGGINGVLGSDTTVTQATQTTGYQIGLGSNGATYNGGAGGGGGGLYGGAGGTADAKSGAGGSGYIANTLLSEKGMYCYNCTESSDVSTKTTTTTYYSEIPTSNYAKSGNGYAKISLVE